MRDAIGAVCVHWSILELTVERVIYFLENGSLSGAEKITYKDGIDDRLKALKKLAGAKLSATKAQKLRNLCGAIRILKEDRHRVVHGLWGLNADGMPVSIYFRAKSGEPAKPMDAAAIRKIKLKIWRAIERLNEHIA